MAPPEVPLRRTRADRFADLVLDAVERLEGRWRRELADVEFAVETVPPVDALEAARDSETVPLSRLYRGGAGHNARVVLYRRPVEARATGGPELAALVQDLITERLAELLEVEPEEIDPDYGLD